MTIEIIQRVAEAEGRSRRRRDASARHQDIGRLWQQIQKQLPRRHTMLVSGPRLDGTWWIGIIDTRKGSRQVLHARGDLIHALTTINKQMKGYVPLGEPVLAAEAEPMTITPPPEVKRPPLPPRGPGGRFLSKAEAEQLKVSPSRVGKPAATPKTSVGFTRDRDVVAYLIKRTQRVTQFELRHQYGIKNPAQAINDFEAQYHVRLTTGDRMENGDIPYTLDTGKLPVIEGMLPMFVDGVEDPDEHLYVMELDLYMCSACGRHPVYRPTKATGHDDETPSYLGLCPRHGPVTFTRG